MSLRSGVCPNCEAEAVHRDPGRFVRSCTPMRVSFGGNAWRVRYVCTACGYIQDFVDPEGARLIRANWPRVEPKA